MNRRSLLKYLGLLPLGLLGVPEAKAGSIENQAPEHSVSPTDSYASMECNTFTIPKSGLYKLNFEIQDSAGAYSSYIVNLPEGYVVSPKLTAERLR